MLVLLFVAMWFILRGDLLCVILFLCFSDPFSIATTSLGEKRAKLSAFRTFVRFCACLNLSVSSFLLGSGKGCGL